MLEKWRQDNRIPMALMAIMGIFLIIYVYDLAGDFSMPDKQLPVPTATVQPISQVSRYHVFGLYDDNLADLPETQLPLTLQGVMLSVMEQSASYAIISSTSVPAKVYRVGDTIPGDATLKKILKNEVLINYQGVLQSLKLPEEPLSFDDNS